MVSVNLETLSTLITVVAKYGVGIVPLRHTLVYNLLEEQDRCQSLREAYCTNFVVHYWHC